MFEKTEVGTNYAKIRKTHIRSILEWISEYELMTTKNNIEPTLEGFKKELESLLNE